MPSGSSTRNALKFSDMATLSESQLCEKCKALVDIRFLPQMLYSGESF